MLAGYTAIQTVGNQILRNKHRPLATKSCETSRRFSVAFWFVCTQLPVHIQYMFQLAFLNNTWTCLHLYWNFWRNSRVICTWHVAVVLILILYGVTYDKYTCVCWEINSAKQLTSVGLTHSHPLLVFTLQVIKWWVWPRDETTGYLHVLCSVNWRLFLICCIFQLDCCV